MIQYELEEDLWSWGSKVKPDVWKICPVNSVGVMGKGLALEFKNRYPALEKVYIEAVEKGFKAGDIKLVSEHKIILAATKQHWKDRSQLSYIKHINSFCYLYYVCRNDRIRFRSVNICLNRINI